MTYPTGTKDIRKSIQLPLRLLKKPQCPDTSDIDGWPALHTAAAAGHEERPFGQDVYCLMGLS